MQRGVIERGFDVTPEDKIAVLPGVMSRKKQMIPNTECISALIYKRLVVTSIDI